MKTSRPPALATWMLEHLVLCSHTHALAGDLLEEFKRRDSAAWYWRQVLAAILVGLWRELALQWRAAAFALVWFLVDYLISRRLFINTHFSPVRPWKFSGEQRAIFIFVPAIAFCLHVSVAWLGLGLYLKLRGVLNAERFTRGQLICLFFILLELGVYMSIWGSALRFIFGPPGIWQPPFLVFLFISRIPTFVALLASLCATLPSSAMRHQRRRYCL